MDQNSQAIADIRQQLNQLRSALGVSDADQAEFKIIDLVNAVQDLEARMAAVEARLG